MPLISAVREWIKRRADDASHAEPISLSTLWWPTLLVVVPIALFLMLVGLIFELIGRIDRGHRLDRWTLWTLSSLVGISLVAVVGWWVFSRL